MYRIAMSVEELESVVSRLSADELSRFSVQHMFDVAVPEKFLLRDPGLGHNGFRWEIHAKNLAGIFAERTAVRVAAEGCRGLPRFRRK